MASCWNAWDWEVDGEAPLRGYIDRMRTLRRCGAERPLTEFKRPTVEESAKSRWALAHQATKGHRAGLGGAIAKDLAKMAAVAEMRNRARAVGVNRAELSSSSMIQLNRTA